MLDAEELSALGRIKDLKQQYRDQFGELQVGTAGRLWRGMERTGEEEGGRIAVWVHRSSAGRAEGKACAGLHDGTMGQGKGREGISTASACACVNSQMVRSEVDYTQQLVDTCVRELTEEFKAWWVG